MMCDVEFVIRAEIEVLYEILRRHCVLVDCWETQQTLLHDIQVNGKVFFGI